MKHNPQHISSHVSENPAIIILISTNTQTIIYNIKCVYLNTSFVLQLLSAVLIFEGEQLLKLTYSYLMFIKTNIYVVL